MKAHLVQHAWHIQDFDVEGVRFELGLVLPLVGGFKDVADLRGRTSVAREWVSLTCMKDTMEQGQGLRLVAPAHAKLTGRRAQPMTAGSAGPAVLLHLFAHGITFCRVP